MAVPDAVVRLVERFGQQREDYRSGRYNETQLRRDFLDPLFAALGWDVHNEQGYAEPYREVIHEDAIKIGGRTKAPDYCFRAGGGVRSFFVEAKKPSVDIREALSPAYQLRRYAWSAKLPVSILTDFEEFAVYDCRIRPVKTDKASTARVIYRQYTDYAECWDELAGLFSPEAIRRGALDKFVTSKRVKKGTAEVDSAFLDEIESWRKLLAQNIALRNKGISQRDLNFAVQRTIDRMIFLRICEDRGIEPYGKLQALLNGPTVYGRLGELFQRADERYNSGLFYFTPEKGRDDPPDELTLGLTIDDKSLKDIIKRFYYPDSPYEFSVLPAEILGQVYEQFLGKVIRLTKGHQAKVEEKPEVRKVGGVYYTPKYIVDYIVQHTVGKLLEGKTPRQAAKLRVLDPACGSGSFLIGAYQHLLDWHRDRYEADDPEKHARGRPPKLYRSRTGEWRLTTAEKKRILLSNIYGVDIDPQAVEVTKLSLLLKVLEGESQETLSNQLRLFQERALPDLSNNIKCGNSLIGPEFYDDRQMSLLDEEERYRVNVFDWKAEFPEVFKGKKGGFDAVIGNPPWVMAGYYVGDELQYLTSHFESATGKFDLYYLFVELGVRLLNEKGRFGMIVPNKFFHTGAARALRRQLSSQCFLHSIVDFGYERIFSGATNYSCILSLEKRPIDCIQFAQSLAGLSIVESYPIPWSELDDSGWHFVAPRKRSLFDKMEAVGTRLGGIVGRFGTGTQTGADRILAFDAETAKECGIEQEIFRPILRGRDVRRYQLGKKLKAVIFPYTERRGEFAIFDEPALRSKFPRAYAYLDQHNKKLAKRIWFGKNAEQLSGQWYGMMYLDSCSAFRKPHLLTPSLSNQSNFALGEGLLFATGTAGVTSIIPDLDCVDLSYLLGILNSSLMSFYATSHSPVFQGGYYKFSAPYLKQFPIRLADRDKPADKTSAKDMNNLVKRRLSIQEELNSVKTSHDKAVLQRQIDATDRQIDRLVYELYELTDEEIAIVEEATP